MDSKIWLAIDDADTEGKWVDYYNGSRKVSYSLPWAPGEPNGDVRENCAVLQPAFGISDYACENFRSHACLCERTPAPYVRLRGLCPESEVRDSLFQPKNDLINFSKLTLTSLRTMIDYDKDTKTWKLTDAESNVTAFSKAPFESFTLGRHNWTIKGDKGCSEDGKEYQAELKMSGCQERSFTCNDGECVSIGQRCDEIPDCRDKSDEKKCDILHLEESYNKNVPPILTRSQQVKLSVSIDILKLVDIKEEDYSIEIQFSITLKWNEPRAIYQNLKEINVQASKM